MHAERSQRDRHGLAGYSPPLLKPRSRTRWTLFVLLNLAGFAWACLMWHYLRSGIWGDLSAEAFSRSLSTSMGQMLLEPLSIFTHPWMIGVIALLLALLIALPLATAVVYQLLVAMVMVVIVAVVAHEPWLALALAAGCLLTARTQWRRNYPFWAIALGLLPVAIYLYLLTYAGIDATLLLPLQQWILAVPFFLALTLVLLAGLLVVAMLRLMRFQPGVLWPVMLLLALPVVAIFYTLIGPAELHYARLHREVTPSSDLFRSEPLDEFVAHHAEGLGEQTLINRLEDNLAVRRRRLQEHCRWYLRQFPRSERAPSVAWINAQAESLQATLPDLEGRIITYHADYPLEPSAEEWHRLVREYDASDPAAIGRAKLARLTLRSLGEGGNARRQTAILQQAKSQLHQARRQLTDILARRDVLERPDASETLSGRVFRPLASLPDTATYRQCLQQVEQLLWIIARNKLQSDPRAAEALGKLLSANPYAPQYPAVIRQLARDQRYADTSMGDNLKLAVAKMQPNAYQRAEMMMALADDERTDAAYEANYELGRLAMQRARAQVIVLVENIKPAEAYFEKIIDAPPNPWQKQAARHLDWLKSLKTDRPGQP
jgi:hypothetical protein